MVSGCISASVPAFAQDSGSRSGSTSGSSSGSTSSLSSSGGSETAISLSEILAKSLTAYGGENSVAQIAGGFSVYGREYNLPGVENLSENFEGATSDSSFRL